MKQGILTIILILFTSLCFSQPKFEGIYNCQGFDPYLNKNYSGQIKITPQNTVYRVEMKYNTGEELIGTAGLYDENTISLVFQSPRNLKKVGLERYSYSADGSKIQGYWVYLGKDKLGKEVCEKIKPNEKI